MTGKTGAQPPQCTVVISPLLRQYLSDRSRAAAPRPQVPQTAAHVPPKPVVTDAQKAPRAVDTAPNRPLRLRRDGSRPLRGSGTVLVRHQSRIALGPAAPHAASAPRSEGDAHGPALASTGVSVLQRVALYRLAGGRIVLTTTVEFDGDGPFAPLYTAEEIESPGDLAGTLALQDPARAIGPGHTTKAALLAAWQGQLRRQYRDLIGRFGIVTSAADLPDRGIAKAPQPCHG